MTDERDEDTMASRKAAPATENEIAEFEKNIRKLIRFRSPFDKHMAALNEMLREREQADEKPGE